MGEMSWVVLQQLMWSAIGLAAAVLIQIAGLGLIARLLGRQDVASQYAGRTWRQAATMGLVVYLLFVLHLTQIAVYALIYNATGAVRPIHTALYFSAATFTTIGGGEVRTEEPWQFFAALQGLSGIIMVGWSISFLVAVSHRLGMWAQDR